MIRKILEIIVIFAVLVAVFFLGAFTFKQEKIVEVDARPTKYDAVLECQKLSALAGDDWRYNDCLEELEKSIVEEYKRIRLN